jgi:hypothetical protein
MSEATTTATATETPKADEKKAPKYTAESPRTKFPKGMLLERPETVMDEDGNDNLLKSNEKKRVCAIRTYKDGPIAGYILRAVKIDPMVFVQTWWESDTLAQVCKKTGLTAASAEARAKTYREEHGIELPEFEKAAGASGVKWGNLADFAKQCKAEAEARKAAAEGGDDAADDAADDAPDDAADDGDDGDDDDGADFL